MGLSVCTESYLMSHLHHPYKNIRDRIGRSAMLYLLTVVPLYLCHSVLACTARVVLAAQWFGVGLVIERSLV